MIAVIQCAGQKSPGAGRMVTPKGMPVEFVADPVAAPANESVVYHRPDDIAPDGKTWRELLSEYNLDRGQNTLGLYPAHDLYDRPIYRRLIQSLGANRVYVLSAGWGLISSSFLIPHYDITFSAAAATYKRRRRSDVYKDYSMLPPDVDEEIFFFGGQDYLPLFSALTSGIHARRTVFNSHAVPDAPGCVMMRFETPKKTNWHYSCAEAFLDGALR